MDNLAGPTLTEKGSARGGRRGRPPPAAALLVLVVILLRLRRLLHRGLAEVVGLRLLDLFGLGLLLFDLFWLGLLLFVLLGLGLLLGGVRSFRLFGLGLFLVRLFLGRPVLLGPGGFRLRCLGLLRLNGGRGRGRGFLRRPGGWPGGGGRA